MMRDSGSTDDDAGAGAGAGAVVVAEVASISAVAGALLGAGAFKIGPVMATLGNPNGR